MTCRRLYVVVGKGGYSLGLPCTTMGAAKAILEKAKDSIGVLPQSFEIVLFRLRYS